MSVQSSTGEPRLVGRNRQLDDLAAHLQSAREGVTGFAVIFGRRRVGKSALVKKFVDDRVDASTVVMFQALQENDPSQRGRFLEALRAAGFEPASDSWSDLLASALRPPYDQPAVVSIDEAPYILETNPGWASALQHEIDRARARHNNPATFLILTGSAVSTITSIISSGGPLYERPTKIIRLDPLSLPESHELLGSEDPQATIEAFAACGGYPLLLNRWNIGDDTDSNLIRLAADPFGPLTVNATSLLLDADSAGHHRVLGAIGRGAHKLAEINGRAGERADRPLATLEAAGLVAKAAPVGEPPRKNVRYLLGDTYLGFWFKVIDRNRPAIESGRGVQAITDAATQWRHHVVQTFELEARRHAARLVAVGDLPPCVIGEWWRDSGTQAQIDVVGVANGRWVLAGEAKWSAAFNYAALSQLQRNLANSPANDSAVLASWSIGGPTVDVVRLRSDMYHFAASDMVQPL